MDKLKIKDIINENNIMWLFETNKIVDNAIPIADDIIERIRNGYRTAPIVKQMLQRGKLYSVNAKYLGIPEYDISYDRDMMRKHVVINIFMFLCSNEKETEYYIKNGLTNCNIRFNVSSFELYIGFCVLNGKYNGKKLKMDIVHEITHFNQGANNNKLKTQKDIDDYNAQYSHITDSYFKQDEGTLKNASYLCYFFTKSEISANINELYSELYEINDINKLNYKSYYENTDFYDKFSYAIEMYNDLFNVPDIMWNKIRKTCQTYKFFKPEMILSKTTNDNVFKKDFLNYIKRMIDYTKQRVDTILTRTIQEKNNN